MQFEYEITAEEYVASQVLYWRLSSGRKFRDRLAACVLGGVFFLVLAWNEPVFNWATVTLAAMGLWRIYSGLMSIFPRFYLRRAYRGTELAGKKYQADVNEEGFEVVGDLCSWRVRWAGVRLKGENKSVFILFTDSVIFMFGKKYLNNEQQSELRKFAGLPAQQPAHHL